MKIKFTYELRGEFTITVEDKDSVDLSRVEANNILDDIISSSETKITEDLKNEFSEINELENEWFTAFETIKK